MKSYTFLFSSSLPFSDDSDDDDIAEDTKALLFRENEAKASVSVLVVSKDKENGAKTTTEAATTLIRRF